MNALLKNLSIIILISLTNSCSKDPICDTFPCDQNKLNVKNFNDINFRKGMWISVTDIKERTTGQDTIIFEQDSIWTWLGDYLPNGIKSGIYHKKYILKQTKSNIGYIYNYANFLNESTTTYRTYEWFYDTSKGYIYIDFNRDFRSLSDPIVYSRFIKVQ